MAQEARAQGVEESVITDARAELDAAIDNVGDDFASLDQESDALDAAMEKYRQALEDAAGTSFDVEPADFDIEGTFNADGETP